MVVKKPKEKKKLSRYTIFLLIMEVVFAVVIGRLIYIQIYKHDDYKERADTTSTKFVSEKSPRGIIYDRNGNVLATNTQTYSMMYTTTEEADKVFFATMDSVFSILSENGEKFIDDLMIKLSGNGEPYFAYKTTTKSDQNAEEIRFKIDRGFNEEIEKELYGDETTNLTEEQKSVVNEKLVGISPKEAFYKLVKSYNLIKLIDENPSDEKIKEYSGMSGEELTNMLLKKYSYEQLRKYILVKDTLKMQSFKGYKTVILSTNIKRDTALIILQKLNDLPGIDIKLEPTRLYPYNELASSVIGYMSAINPSNEQKYELRGYDASSDLVGVSGIESAFEEQLKGVKGGTTVKVNSKGRVTKELFKLETYPGNNIHLTIDKNIQYAAEQSLKDTMESIRNSNEAPYPGATRGAVVAVEVNTGRILASVSYPNYNPNIFAISGQLTSDQTKEYFSPNLESFGEKFINSRGLNKTIDELFPIVDGLRTDPYDLYPRAFYNYATQGLIPPGSTFKPLTGLIGLEKGVVYPSSTIYDKGKFNDHPETFGTAFGPECLLYTNYHVTHGNTDITHALEVSCNYYFYEVAYRLYKQAGSGVEGLDSIAKYAWKFGLGANPSTKERNSTGIEIEENFGQVYNFTSFKNQSILYAKFELRDYLESGKYKGIKFFVPFDYSNNGDDSERLKEIKISLKDKVADRFNKIGVDNSGLNTDEFAKTLLDDIKNIMNLSNKYKQNVSEYESKYNKKVNLDSQAQIIAEVIARFVVNDKGSEITSPAQAIYASIGQGMNNFTPTQLASYVSTLANGGTRYKLHFVDKVTSSNGDIIQKYDPEVLDKIELKDSTIKAIREGMYKANNDEGGTAARVFGNFPIRTGGKTGTADFAERQKEIGRAPYATYISFAPLENPEIAFVGVIYDGGHGSSTAPVAKAIYEAYFKEKLEKEFPWYTSASTTYQKYVVGAP
ncbi:penicillin-binding transpeptidase domain-containing protein [Clostridium sp. SHJSY1]|uniref:penicillin-binding transpeptidase domain-containing protein n=1 Tax=Clostridium sp. SHJSY1 TaxID=2942483 RepID=UPI00287616D0|nr:penicillin-binding transpeptidase domain-containing protein [Clostridium sp. SHJSY1]MDS0528015.1 penicillin-binding transpeptidase domain-containing protein [Clostridium sp. SHJSY1]